MTVLILGGSGQLGRSLLSANSEYSHQIVAPTRLQLDITNSDSVNKYLLEVRPKFVINASAWTNVPAAELDPQGAKAVNEYGIRNLASGCKLINACLLHVSTDYVFDGNKVDGYTENDPTNPLNVYGRTKLSGEEALAEMKLENHYIVRTSWLYSKFGSNFAKTMARKALSNERASVVDDQFGSPTFAGDLAVAIMELIESPAPSGIYHYSNSGSASWFQFAKEIYAICDVDVNLVSPRLTEKMELARPRYSSFDLTKWSDLNLSQPRPWKDSLTIAMEEIKLEVKREAS